MNVWIASDITAVPCTAEAAGLMEKRGADRLVLLGDLLYHGPGTTCRRDTIPRRSLPC